ncbi:MAG: heat-inducible transcription repressor HrcA [Nitrospirae bacterium]|nr:heat-inducible transcription repressor HrcA [Nitrospirota bacterium]
MLEERDKKVLCAIVQSYINRPDPVGSGFITKSYSFSLSPATIRNIMADLVEMGFLRQPHTSAGRVPTDKGYRLYVDSLCSGESEPDNRKFVHDLAGELESIKNDIDLLFEETTKRLSSFSHYLSAVLSPNAGVATFNKIKLLKHSGNQIVTLLFTDEGLVKNRTIDLGSEISQRDLNRIALYLNSEFYGFNLDEIRLRIMREMAEEKIVCDRLISRALRICKEAVAFPYDNIFISGFSEVLRLPEFSDVERIKDISRAIEDKHLIVKLLDSLLESGNTSVQVLIGSENSVSEMKQFSMVAAIYKKGDKPVGSVGIIGPTRMDYSKAICMVDLTALFLSRMLSER